MATPQPVPNRWTHLPLLCVLSVSALSSPTSRGFPLKHPLTNILLDNSIPNCHTFPIEKCARDFSSAGFPLNLKFNLSGELLCPKTRIARSRVSISSPTAAVARCPLLPTTWASAISTPKNSRIASTPRKPAARSANSSKPTSSPPAT